MEYRNQRNDKLVSLLGFGAMRLPVTKEGLIDREEAKAMIDYAYQHGVNYFDTAYPYHNGESEPFVGEVLNDYPRDSYFLATKLPMWQIKTLEDAKVMFNKQLERIDKDYIDFYLLHSMNKDTWKIVLDNNILDFLMEMKKAGKIRNIGFSFHDEYPVFEDMILKFPWDFCQIQFNYMDQDIQAGLKGVKLVEEHKIPLVIMEPIKGGTLANLPDDVKTLMTDYNKDATIASWALRWVAQFSGVMTILSGMSTMDQVIDNINTFTNYKKMTIDENEIINMIEKTLSARVRNGCTGCGYCIPCPAGVRIPICFRAWNEYAKYGTPKVIEWAWHNIESIKGGPDVCIKCGKCEKLCPQHIKIRDDLVKVQKELDPLFKK